MLARSEAGALPVEKEPFALDATLQTVLDQYREPAERAGIRLRDGFEPATLVADEDLIVQLLVNLLDNAVAYTPAGGEIGAGNQFEDGSIHIWVTNTGPGIAEEHLPHLFEPFYRVDTGRCTTERRSGPGPRHLQSHRRRAHNGSIAIVSQPESPTRVDISLPAS